MADVNTDSVIGSYVILRTYSAGVHVGILEEFHGTHAWLSESRRIWRWSGANTLSEISLRGVGDNSRISEKVPKILLTEVIEVLPCSDAARANLDRDGQWS